MRRASILVVLFALALPAGAAALAVAPVPVNPNSACATGNPCSLDHALQIASSGDDIVMAPGPYKLTVQRNLDGVDVYGQPDQPAPQILESNNAYFSLSNGELRHVGVVQTSGAGVQAAALAINASAEDVVLRCANQCPYVVDLAEVKSVKDAVITGPMALVGVEVTGANTVLRNLTVLVGGTNSHGIAGNANDPNTSVDLRNSIVRGASADLAFIGNGNGAKLSYGWSDVRPGSQFLNGGLLVDLGHNVAEEPPRIADAVGGDVHLLATSALIDAGTSDLLGAFDLDGATRVFGAAPDIGADEAFFPPPGAETGDASAIAATTATIAGVVTPANQATTYRFEWGKTSAYGQATTDAGIGNGSQAQPVSTALTGLDPDTVYHYRLVATSAFGTTAGIDKVLRTAATPEATPDPQPGPFTGTLAKTKAAKVDKHGRFFVVLSCPASAVTGCAGSVRLGLPLAKPAKFAAAAGKTARVRLTLLRAGRRLLGRKGLRTSLVVLATDGVGREHGTVKNLLLRSAG